MVKDVNLKYIVGQACVVLLGGIQIGFCTTSEMHNINFKNRSLNFLKSLDYLISLIAIISLGAVFGAILSGLLTKQSRRRILFLAHLIIILGSSIQIIEDSYLYQGSACIYTGKFMNGIGLGILSVFVPIILKEISPTEISGAVVGSTECAISLGIVISVIIQSTLDEKFSYKDRLYWRIVYACPVFIGFISIIIVMFLFKRETPRYLAVDKGDNERCREALENIYLNRRIDRELDDLIEIKQIECLQNERWSWDEICSPINQKPLIVGCILCVLRECTGITVYAIFLPILFPILDNIYDDDNNNLGFLVFSASFAAIKFASSLLCLLIVDTLGRKKLLIYFSPLLVIILTSLALLNIFEHKHIAITICICTLLYFFVFCFELSYGTIMWIYLCDLLPVKGVSIGITIYWNSIIIICLFSFLSHKPLTEDSSDSIRFVSISFGIFAFLTLMGLYFVYKYVFESKNMDERTIKRRYLVPKVIGSTARLSVAYETPIIRTSHNPDFTFENRINML